MLLLFFKSFFYLFPFADTFGNVSGGIKEEEGGE